MLLEVVKARKSQSRGQGWYRIISCQPTVGLVISEVKLKVSLPNRHTISGLNNRDFPGYINNHIFTSILFLALY
jgi:hypothetical protein